MTYADEEFLPEGQVETPNYPTAFGITFTPKVGGIIFAVLGLLGAAYLFVNVVQPEWARNQTLQDEKAKIQDDIQKLEDTKKKIALKKQELEAAKVQNKQVLSLFANEKTLDTLLLNLNSSIKEREGASLETYNPGENSPATDGVINDGSLGAEVNGKLKRKTVNVELVGSFNQIQSIMRSFERLQTLLVVKDFKLETSDEPIIVLVDPSGKSVPGVRKKDKPGQAGVVTNANPNLKATFKLEVLMPVKPEEPNAALTTLGQKLTP
jgi:type IV pilus assembly protein PilO